MIYYVRNRHSWFWDLELLFYNRPKNFVLAHRNISRETYIMSALIQTSCNVSEIQGSEVKKIKINNLPNILVLWIRRRSRPCYRQELSCEGHKQWNSNERLHHGFASIDCTRDDRWVLHLRIAAYKDIRSGHRLLRLLKSTKHWALWIKGGVKSAKRSPSAGCNVKIQRKECWCNQTYKTSEKSKISWFTLKKAILPN